MHPHCPHGPIRIDTPGADTAVLAMHGFMGSPLFFEPLLKPARALGLAFHAPLLPGHGASARAFAITGRAQWEEAAQAALAAARERYPRLILLGHSMGCLLLLRACLPGSPEVAGLAAIAPALRIAMRPRALVNSLAAIGAGELPPGHLARESRRLNAVARGSVWDDLRAFPRYLDLLHLAKETRRTLPQTAFPIRAYLGARDELVPPRAARELQRAPHADCTMLPNATHLYFGADDWACIAAGLAAMCAGPAPEKTGRGALQ